MDKRDRLRDIIAVSEQSEISDRDAWIEEQRHKWMCGEQPDYLEDCPFQSLGVHLDSGSITALKVQLL